MQLKLKINKTYKRTRKCRGGCVLLEKSFAVRTSHLFLFNISRILPYWAAFDTLYQKANIDKSYELTLQMFKL